MQAKKQWTFHYKDKTVTTTLWSDTSISCDCGRPECSHVRNEQVAGLQAVAQTVLRGHPPVAKPVAPKAARAVDGTVIAAPKPKFTPTAIKGDSLIKPMLAHEITDPEELKRLIKNDAHAYEPKIDGERALIHVKKARTQACYSRLGNSSLDKKGAEWLAAVKWPFDEGVLDTELAAAGGVCVAGKSVTTAKSKAGLEKSIVIFDLLSLDGQDCKKLPYSQRRALLESKFKNFRHPNIELCPVSDDALGLWKEWVEKRNGEGIMLKRKNSTYVPGWRSPHWLKLKMIMTVDVVCIGTTREATYSRTGYRTAEAAMVFGFWNPKTKQYDVAGQGCVLGKEVDLKKYVAEQRVMELKCNGIMESGKLRSARFKCWRTDKAPQECVRP